MTQIPPSMTHHISNIEEFSKHIPDVQLTAELAKRIRFGLVVTPKAPTGKNGMPMPSTQAPRPQIALGAITPLSAQSVEGSVQDTVTVWNTLRSQNFAHFRYDGIFRSTSPDGRPQFYLWDNPVNNHCSHDMVKSGLLRSLPLDLSQDEATTLATHFGMQITADEICYQGANRYRMALQAGLESEYQQQLDSEPLKSTLPATRLAQVYEALEALKPEAPQMWMQTTTSLIVGTVIGGGILALLFRMMHRGPTDTPPTGGGGEGGRSIIITEVGESTPLLPEQSEPRLLPKSKPTSSYSRSSLWGIAPQLRQLAPISHIHDAITVPKPSREWPKLEDISPKSDTSDTEDVESNDVDWYMLAAGLGCGLLALGGAALTTAGGVTSTAAAATPIPGDEVVVALATARSAAYTAEQTRRAASYFAGFSASAWSALTGDD